MPLCKAMILVGALLLVPTLQNRIKWVNGLEPHQPEEMIKHPADHAMEKTMTEIVEHKQEQLAEALVEEDAAGEAVAALGEASTGQGLPRGPSAKRVARSAAAVGEKKGNSKDAGKGKRKDKGKDEGNDADKDKGNQLVTGNGDGKATGKIISKGGNQLVKGKGDGKATGEIISKGGEHSWFRFPIWGGKWWISRLAFLRGPFAGTIYQEIPATKTLLVKSWKAQEEFGQEVIIPLSCNSVGAKVGDKITFDVKQFVQEGEGKPKPLANNVIIRQRGHAVGEGLVKGPALTDVRTQVLYYISDENLRTDKFFQDIIATTEGGWISTDFLLLCRRLQKLGASAKSIVECLRDAPGVEVRDMPGQEAVRRTSPPPPLEPGSVARKEAVFPIVDDRWAAKSKYTLDAMKSMGGHVVEKTREMIVGQGQEELAEAAGPEPDEQEHWPTRVKQAAKKWAAKRKAAGDARQAEHKARARSKREEKTQERAKKAAVNKAAAKKAAAEKPAAKKAMAEEDLAPRSWQAAAQKSAAEKAAAFATRSLQVQPAADEAATEHSAAEKAGEEAAAAPGPTSDKQKSWGSWFSMLPRAAWGYLGLPVTTGNPGDEEKEAGEQNADDAKEQQ